MSTKTKKARFSVDNENRDDCVYFFKMNGCKHCENLEPIWKEVVATIKKDNPSVVFVDVESAEIKNLDDYAKNKLNVDKIFGYPDLRILKKNGDTSTFQANRTVEDLVNWIKTNINTQQNRSTVKRLPTPYPRKSKKRTVGGKRRRRRITRRIGRRRMSIKRQR
jgi:thiol-disulfide isomerase/thioredoxin